MVKEVSCTYAQLTSLKKNYLYLYVPFQTGLPVIHLTKYIRPTKIKKNGPVNPSNAINFVP